MGKVTSKVEKVNARAVDAVFVDLKDRLSREYGAIW